MEVGAYGLSTCLYEELVADARVVDVVDRRGEDDGKRLEIRHDVLQTQHTSSQSTQNT